MKILFVNNVHKKLILPTFRLDAPTSNPPPLSWNLQKDPLTLRMHDGNRSSDRLHGIDR